MKKLIGIALLLASFAGASHAQSTNVSGTILDPNGFPYTNAVINVILSPAPSGPATCGTQPLRPVPSFTANVNGHFEIGLCPNASISSGGVSGGSQWQFNVSISPGVPPPDGFGPQSFSIAVTIAGGSQDVSATLSAVAPVLARSTGATGVTSVGLSMPQQYIVSGSPVTSAGTLAAQWLPVAQGAYLGGPTPNTVGGIFDGLVPGTSGVGSDSITITGTPTIPNDVAFFLSQAGGFLICSTPVVMTGSGTWTNQFTNGNNGALFTQPLTGTPSLTGTANCTSGGAALWTGQLFFLSTSGTLTFRQSTEVSGAISSGRTLAFPGSVIGGHGILAIVEGIPPSAATLTGSMTDTQGNNYTPLGIVQNGGASISMAFLAANINTSGSDTLTFNSTGSTITGGIMYIAEITNLAAQNALPTFHPIPLADLPLGTVTVTGTPTGNSLACFFFPGGSSFPITNCDLTGDVTTSGSPATTVHKVNGVSITGTPTPGQVPTATSGTTATWQTPPTGTTGVQVFQDTPMSVDVTVGTTNTTVLTQAVTMPSSGCPCRVEYSFSLWPEFATFTNVAEVSAWITDGTTNFRGVQTGQSNASTGARTSMTYTGWTTSTYANSASVTFTLLAIAQTGGGFVLKAAPEVGSSANAGMTFAVFTSN